ncbi:hypothetical protein BST96_09895 [Oceanicoccus sagamiensis]|uniref:Uncharacterized protein n=2 Tax=Oceanicoccus sagamiensis TaxID=716816 RepID=A0A1X9NHM1_9GAMM|nr:hypothetical protein BST96_09895 [Oceanicoccus sagamiensis]
MVIHSTAPSTASLSASLSRQSTDMPKRESSNNELIEQAKQVDQDAITEGVGETPLANPPMPAVVPPAQKSAAIVPQMQTKMTMDSITDRYQANFERMQEVGRTIDVRA